MATDGRAARPGRPHARCCRGSEYFAAGGVLTLPFAGGVDGGDCPLRGRGPGLDERLRHYRAATSGVERLEAFVEFWEELYIPQIYGIARALLAARETDEAVAAAWDDRMATVREGCGNIIDALHRDGMLAPEWPRYEAVDLLWTMLSIRNWEQLTIERGWSTSQYVGRTQELSKRTFVGGTGEA